MVSHTWIFFFFWSLIALIRLTISRYPYPIFDLLTVPQRAVLFTVSGLLMSGSTMGLKWVYGKVNGIEKFKKDALNPVKSD